MKNDRVTRLGAALLGSLLLVATAHFARSAFPEVAYIDYRFVAPAVGALSIGMAVMPEALARRFQTVSVFVIFVLFRALPWRGWVSVVALALPALVSLVIWRFPMRTRGSRVAFIIATTALLPFLQLGLTTLGVAKMAAWMVSRDIVLWTVVGEFIGRQTQRASLADIQRALFSNFYFNAAPLPIEDTQKLEISPRTILTGAAWVSGGLALRTAAERFVTAWPNPIGAFAHGRILIGLFESFIAVVFFTVIVGWRTFINSGIARMIGMPIRAPMDEPWRARNFLDYWRRMNVHNYKMLNEVYFKTFVPMRGRWLPIGVFFVFCLSGAEHMWRVGYDVGMTVRWVLDGFISAMTAAWQQAGAKKRAQAYIKTRESARTRTSNRARQLALGVGGFVWVFAAHGVLLQLSWATDELLARGGILFGPG